MKEVINKAYKFRIYPSIDQEVFFAKHFGCVRFIYNHLLGIRRDIYKKEGKSLNGFACKKMISLLKKQKKYEWLKDVNSQSLQEAAICLERSFQRFFNKEIKSGYPRLKKKGYHDAFCVPQNFQMDPKNNFLFIPKLKTPIKTRFHRSLNKVIKFNSITISKTPAGKYYASINGEEEWVRNGPVKKKTQKTVGIDLGLKDFLVESNGNKKNAPGYLRQSEEKLKKTQQKLSRRQKGSQNRKKQRLVVAKLHERIKNQRTNFLHQESSRLVNENQVIYLETLNVQGMLRNHRLSKSIADGGWGEFIRQLKYKAHWQRKMIVQVGECGKRRASFAQQI